MRHQALNLHVPDPRGPLARVLAVTSGKGGVGKTNVAANLALCWAASRRRVLLLDADISLGNLDLIMDVRSKYNVSHLIGGHRRIEEVIQDGPEGLRIICGASGLEKLADLGESQQQLLLHHLSKLQCETDAIVVDTGAGISSTVVSFCLAADHVLVVTTPEATAMADAYGMIKVLVRRRYKGPISVLVNMAGSTEEGKQVYHRMARVARRFLQRDIYHAGILLKDKCLCSAVRARRPVVLAYPRSPISCAFATLAARLGGTPRDGHARDSFFRKAIRWLH